ncbi:MAG: ABC transporter permease subunit [Gammaproteobacteria bacterium]|nr:ABC transporter permease subunit [Gammaproteobacteria bacterium]
MNQSNLRDRKFSRKIRYLKDKIASVGIAVGGISVIVAILLIFFYLLYEVQPLFASAEVSEPTAYQLTNVSESPPLHLAIEEQSELAVRLNSSGVVVFFELADGSEVSRFEIELPSEAAVTSFALDSEESGVFALGLDSGQVVIARYAYEISFSGASNARSINPRIEYPFGKDPYEFKDIGSIAVLGLRTNRDSLVIAASDGAEKLGLLRATKETNLFSVFETGGDEEFEIEQAFATSSMADLEQIYIDGDQLWAYFVTKGGYARLIELKEAFESNEPVFSVESQLTEAGVNPTDIEFLLGGVSLLVADDSGQIAQWFLIQRNEEIKLEKIRQFNSSDVALREITSEQRRKNFITLDLEGNVGIYNTTSHSASFEGRLASPEAHSLAVSPRGDSLLIESTGGNFQRLDIKNDHPEVSWSALWSRVWYEGYSEPEYIWQSSAATNEFEPKYSLSPLAFGTLKAAVYAMLMAAPLAVCGAIFTGYFMAAPMRRQVKPLIELMQALPTVVLGFLAGLWLAPFIEKNLLGVFSIFFILPVCILGASFVWTVLPGRIRHSLPDGWEAGLLIPVILIFSYLSFELSSPIENMFFDGDLRFWITNELGVSYDQRNAMVVGIAMGFAVIPTIFSIAEDAIFTVPRHLTYGSLALGATPWQSLYRVVLPTASPGIFSALMIGMGRAVGETMIVLMATGNTPIMDASIFEGMRTLAANIAVEIPESEVDSTHYRILFLAALVLFLFTFAVNTIAEVVRQQLRGKYSTI